MIENRRFSNITLLLPLDGEGTKFVRCNRIIQYVTFEEVILYLPFTRNVLKLVDTDVDVEVILMPEVIY